MGNIFQYTRFSKIRRVVDVFLAVRALLFVGTKYHCPCCAWNLRAFTHGGGSLQVRYHGYCPRCNAKARHRRDWLFLEEHTNLFATPLRLLHVAPKYSLSRRFVRMKHIEYIGVDIFDRPNVNTRMNIDAVSFSSNTFDAIICIHVLEHVLEDRKAMRELYRVLKPGGWALISVPLRLDQRTFEDSTITSPAERMRAFGENDHVRLYGYDLVDRLEESGFQVKLNHAEDIPKDSINKYGLLEDENILFCTKVSS
jgi:predicted SAM-dependent methyltransferase